MRDPVTENKKGSTKISDIESQGSLDLSNSNHSMYFSFSKLFKFRNTSRELNIHVLLANEVQERKD